MSHSFSALIASSAAAVLALVAGQACAQSAPVDPAASVPEAELAETVTGAGEALDALKVLDKATLNTGGDEAIAYTDQALRAKGYENGFASLGMNPSDIPTGVSVAGLIPGVPALDTMAAKLTTLAD